LQRSWSEPIRSIPRYRVLTPREPGRSGAIGLLSLEGVPASALVEYLMREHGIFTAVQKTPGESGVRITPGLPTSREHIGRLLTALQAAADQL
jgi:selenocysteine lyase/cysteine desulfurase